MINGELIVDNFAGGGGASTGMEMATGYSVDIAINHDPEAIRMHKANHPNTKHYCEDVWQVDPVKACNGHPVGLAWFSPDCKGDVGYLNVAQNDFGSHKFRKLKAGSKLLYLYMQRFVNGKHMTMDHFYEKFCEMFGVVKKSLQQYVHELKMNKLLFISRKRNKAYNYEIMMKRSTVLFKKSIQMLREKEYYVNNICALIKTNFSKMAENSNDKAIKDIASLVDTQRAGQHRNFIAVVLSAIKKSLTIQRKEGKKKLELNAALVNRCLTELLEQPAV